MARTGYLASIVLFASLAACAGEPTAPGLPGERNTALRAAADHYGVSADWLSAIAFQQGRFESAETEDTATAAASDPADTLGEDTPLDDSGDPVAVDDAPMGDHVDGPAGWGVMYLSDAQVARAADLTGKSPDAIRTEHAANIEAAAALLTEHGASEEAVRGSTIDLLGLADDAESAELALADLDSVITEGFDLVTSDGEHLVLEGTAPVPDTAEAVAPGHYPSIQFIASPNYSSRQGYGIRYIVVHDIEGTMAAAIAVFKNSANDASAHYIVRARDGHIVQMVREANNAWHVGHGWFNRHSIGIEHEGFAHKKNGGGYYTDKQYQASARLACAVAHRYGIPVNRAHIFGHFNVPSNLSSHTLCSDARGIAGKCGGVSHHSDPGKYWNWTKYLTLVRGCVNAAG